MTSKLIALSLLCYIPVNALASTELEFFSIIDNAIKAVIPSGAKWSFENAKLTTREQLILGLHLRMQRSREYWKGTPLPVNLPKSVQKENLSPSAQAALVDLVRFGFVDKFGPLVTLQDFPNPQQAGRIAAHFLSRFADLTHRPDPEFSPYLSVPKS